MAIWLKEWVQDFWLNVEEGILDVIGFDDDGEETIDLDLDKLSDEKLQVTPLQFLFNEFVYTYNTYVFHVKIHSKFHVVSDAP